MESIFNSSFKDHLVSNYMSTTPRKIKFSQFALLIDFIIANQIIPSKVIRIYTVINEYNYMLEEKRYKNKTQLIKAISSKFNLHENTVWNIVRDHIDSFEAQKGGIQDK